MDNNIKNLLRSELYSATSYTERIFHAINDIAGLSPTPEARELCAKMSFDLEACLSSSLLENWLTQDGLYTNEVKNLRQYLKVINPLLESLIQLPTNQEKTVDLLVEYINLLYRHNRELHSLCAEMASVEIQLPRVNLIDILEDSHNHHTIPRFHLPLNQIMGASSNELGSISSLEWQRQKKYDQFLQKGHEAIYNKEYDKSLEYFLKSLNYQETAEVLTLVGWAYSLLGKNDKAKSYCLKSIKKDPDYGPPYNDLGTYLMAEGQIDESLKWFELAKRSPNYQNREFPYINAGRAYMSKQNIVKALEEFSKALTLAPFHEELHKTVERLKATLHKDDKDISLTLNKNDHEPSDLPPSVF